MKVTNRYLSRLELSVNNPELSTDLNLLIQIDYSLKV